MGAASGLRSEGKVRELGSKVVRVFDRVVVVGD